MDSSALDTTPISTSQLLVEYGISSRTTLNDRLKALGFESFKIGRETYVRKWQKDILDRQNAWVQEGRTLASFQPYTEDTQWIHSPTHSPDASPDVAPDVLNGLATRTQPIQLVIVQQPAPNPLAPQTYLSRCAVEQFTLHTEQLLEIIGYKRAPKSPHYYGGFICQRIAPRSKWWRIRFDTHLLD